MGNTLSLEFKGFEELLTELDKLEGDLKTVVDDALTQMAETVAEDTLEAVEKSNLPAGGKYSIGDTKKSIVNNPTVSWIGSVAEIAVGFDYSKNGSGGLLITGTPRMKPVAALQTIYKRKKYRQWLEEGMQEIVMDAIKEALGR